MTTRDLYRLAYRRTRCLARRGQQVNYIVYRSHIPWYLQIRADESYEHRRYTAPNRDTWAWRLTFQRERIVSEVRAYYWSFLKYVC